MYNNELFAYQLKIGYPVVKPTGFFTVESISLTDYGLAIELRNKADGQVTTDRVHGTTLYTVPHRGKIRENETIH